MVCYIMGNWIKNIDPSPSCVSTLNSPPWAFTISFIVCITDGTDYDSKTQSLLLTSDVKHINQKLEDHDQRFDKIDQRFDRLEAKMDKMIDKMHEDKFDRYALSVNSRLKNSETEEK